MEVLFAKPGLREETLLQVDVLWFISMHQMLSFGLLNLALLGLIVAFVIKLCIALPSSLSR